ncbi:muscle M-line assembly protein unc-89-like isoform X4 [Pecten maximus]|uniref:muscle M-line assembly protein unc-89-like isoform X4 n=1 Tax=Pecten maximus TaxID=6579 RepID=UPI001458B4FE|nr:muscle M-line assembly protein unc-89-like isoform X4 [Pecten maximus]
MAKGGGDKTYFVGTIKKTNEPSRSLARDKSSVSITYATEQTLKDAEREEETSPSGGSKKVRFVEGQDNKEQSPGLVSTSQTGSTSLVKGSNSRASSRNTVNEKSGRTDSRVSKSSSKSFGTQSRASITSNRIGSNGTTNASVSVPQSARSQQTETGSQFKFYANSDVTPDTHSLISPAGKRTGASLPSATPSSKRSDDFRFHAGYDDDFEEEDANSKQPQNGKFGATPTKEITSGSAKSSGKPRIDSTPSLPPAKQNGGLVTSNDGGQTSKPQSPEKSKRSTADVKTQSIPNISQKNADGTLATRQPPTSSSKSKREDQPPSSPSKTKRDDNKLPSSPSKTKREDQPPSSPSKSKRDDKPPPSPLKENHPSSFDKNKSRKPTSSQSAATVKSQSNKENTKPSQEPTQPTLTKDNVQKTNGNS